MPEIIVGAGYDPTVGSADYRNCQIPSTRLLVIRPEWRHDMVEIIQDGLRCVPDANHDLKDYLQQQCRLMQS